MTRLIRARGLAPDLAGGLAQLCRLLSDVRDIDLTSRCFGQVQLYRNNQFYDFLLKVCELVFRHLLPTEQPGASQFRDFLRDERQMAVLFENFVRNFYRTETAYRVKREDIYWQWIAVDQFHPTVNCLTCNRCPYWTPHGNRSRRRSTPPRPTS